MFLGIYDYTVVLDLYKPGNFRIWNYHELWKGIFRIAIFCLALVRIYATCLMEKLPEQRRTAQMMRRVSEFRLIPFVMWFVSEFFRQ